MIGPHFQDKFLVSIGMQHGNVFGGQAFQRAADFAHIESLTGDEAAVARWRRVMVLIRDQSAAGRGQVRPASIDMRLSRRG